LPGCLEVAGKCGGGNGGVGEWWRWAERVGKSGVKGMAGKPVGS
nr:hypothetical protein [Tanacetum cinerariifolium]